MTFRISEGGRYWRPPGDLPNEVGFRFLALLKDGRGFRECEVIFKDGRHTVDDYKSILGWRPLDAKG